MDLICKIERRGGSTLRGPRLIDAMPVQLLRDGRGVYGVGVAEECNEEALARMCGVERARPVYVPQPLILRPDYLERPLPVRQHRAALQKIPGGFRRRIFRCTTEEALRQFIHHEALERAGLPYPPPHDSEQPDRRWWSTDKARQVENQRKYHGLRLLSLSLVNRLIGQLIEEAADRDAIRAARRFTLDYREDIYRCAALSKRAVQLTDSFPVLALALYSRWRALSAGGDPRAAILVERGARLRDVAAALQIPMALRRLKPGVAHLVTKFLVQHPDLLQWMPNETPAARIWVTVVCLAGDRDADFGGWVARHVLEVPGKLEQVSHTIGDVFDWAHANTRGNGRKFVARRFTPSMALKTAINASHDWHEAVASHMDDAADLALPPPWYPPATLGRFDIVPLISSVDLYREGHAMHHCVATYVDQVRQGSSYIFSVRGGGKRIATLSLTCHGETVLIQQLRGPCDAAPSKAVAAAVRQWLRLQRTTAAMIKQRYDEWRDADPETAKIGSRRAGIGYRARRRTYR